MGVMDTLYARILRPLFFLQTPDNAHAMMIRVLALLDAMPFAAWLLSGRDVQKPVAAGGVSLPSRVMIAAGLVKGRGLTTRNSVETAKREKYLGMAQYSALAGQSSSARTHVIPERVTPAL